MVDALAVQQLAQHAGQRVDAGGVKIGHTKRHRVHLVGSAHRADVRHPHAQAATSDFHLGGDGVQAVHHIVKAAHVNLIGILG